MSCRQHKKSVLALLLIALLNLTEVALCAEDLVLEGVYEAALDLPRILFLLKRSPNGPPLTYQGRFQRNYAFLDTGASGVLLSRETANFLQLAVEPNAQFVDVGVGGEEYFDVSEPLYIGLADYEENRAHDPNVYTVLGPGRFQIKRNTAGLLAEPIDVVGMPALAGQIIVLNSGATNNLGYFTADIKERGDPAIPVSDIVVTLRFANFLNPNNPNNTGPLPVTAYNPVIDNIIITHNDKTSTANWLFDTGATISLISTEQAGKLGLTNKNGKPIGRPDFSLPVGGIGSMVLIPGFEIDRLTVPTLSGRNLVFKNARIGVHDIRYFDEKRGEYTVLDGIFGSNFLCASAKMEGLLPSDIGSTVFDNIILDMEKGLVGFDISDYHTQH